MNNPIELFQAAIAQAVQDGLSGIHCALPGRVEEYDASTQSATVQPLLMRAYKTASGEREAITLPPIPSVPVLTFRGGGFRFHLPVTKGDTVILLFSDGSLDRWLQRGGIVDPADDRQHHLSDAIAIPGLLDFANAWSGLSVDRAALGYDGQAQLEIFPNGEIHAGGTERLVKKGEFDTHTHPVATTGTATAQTGTAAAPTVPAVGTAKLRG